MVELGYIIMYWLISLVLLPWTGYHIPSSVDVYLVVCYCVALRSCPLAADGVALYCEVFPTWGPPLVDFQSQSLPLFCHVL